MLLRTWEPMTDHLERKNENDKELEDLQLCKVIKEADAFSRLIKKTSLLFSTSLNQRIIKSWLRTTLVTDRLLLIFVRVQLPQKNSRFLAKMSSFCNLKNVLPPPPFPKHRISAYTSVQMYLCNNNNNVIQELNILIQSITNLIHIYRHFYTRTIYIGFVVHPNY